MASATTSVSTRASVATSTGAGQTGSSTASSTTSGGQGSSTGTQSVAATTTGSSSKTAASATTGTSGFTVVGAPPAYELLVVDPAATNSLSVVLLSGNKVANFPIATSDAGASGEPAWSPDTRIAYGTEGGGPLVVEDLESGDFLSAHACSEPTWSSQGLVCTAGGLDEVDINGDGVAWFQSGTITAPMWAPSDIAGLDGTDLIAFLTSGAAGAPGHLEVQMGPGTLPAQVFGPTPGLVYAYSWSPEGTRIAAIGSTSGSDGGCELDVFTLATGDAGLTPRLLVPKVPCDGLVAWSPADGGPIAFTGSGGLPQLILPDGGSLEEGEGALFQTEELVWPPDGAALGVLGQPIADGGRVFAFAGSSPVIYGSDDLELAFYTGQHVRPLIYYQNGATLAADGAVQSIDGGVLTVELTDERCLSSGSGTFDLVIQANVAGGLAGTYSGTANLVVLGNTYPNLSTMVQIVAVTDAGVAGTFLTQGTEGASLLSGLFDGEFCASTNP